ncbi:MAG: hypothetical protein CMK46_08270 [Porticoccus sp.]|nr:hypothetical protein [Porticoccus sp.]|tara:strand:+ start:24782 stop:25069 length:288 start_codon:yes stop_codon:yes gene_type:complete
MNSVDTFSSSCQSCLYHQWEEECVMYNPVSGETHLLEATAAKILITIAAAPTRYDQLSLLLQEELDDVPETEIDEYICTTLQKLQDMHLISATGK